MLVSLKKLSVEINNWYIKSDTPIHINEPLISNEDISSVVETLEEKWVSTAGPIVTEFERSIASAFDNTNAVALNSGTSALHLSLLSLDITSSDLVILAPLTFVAPLNAIKYLGATPLFIDISLDDLSIDIAKLNHYAEKYFSTKNNKTVDLKTKKIVKALIVVDVFGHLGNMKAYREFCNKYRISLIVDSAESVGSKRGGLTSASFSDITTTSFNGNKIITSGSGGAVISKKEDLIEKIKHLSTTANIGSKDFSYYHDQVGYNYRLPAINAALGNSQIKELKNKVSNFRKIHSKYKQLLRNMDELKIFSEVDDAHSNYWLNLFLLKDKASKEEKNEFIRKLNKSGIGARNVWNPLYDLPYVNKDEELNYENADHVFNYGFNLPSTSKLNTP